MTARKRKKESGAKAATGKDRKLSTDTERLGFALPGNLCKYFLVSGIIYHVNERIPAGTQTMEMLVKMGTCGHIAYRFCVLFWRAVKGDRPAGNATKKLE